MGDHNHTPDYAYHPDCRGCQYEDVSYPPVATYEETDWTGTQDYWATVRKGLGLNENKRINFSHPDTITFTITAKDIKHGGGNPLGCAAAVALRRMFPDKFVSVGNPDVYIDDKALCYTNKYLESPELQAFISAIDHGGNPQPGVYTITKANSDNFGVDKWKE